MTDRATAAERAPSRAPIVVVGASLAAVCFIDRYRAAGGDAEITLVGAESRLPYDRPPLSKEALRDSGWTPEAAALRPDSWYAGSGVTLRLGLTATRLHPDRLVVDLDDGTALPAYAVLVTTGSRTRLLPGLPPGGVVHYLREMPDALRLRAALHERTGQLVVVGAGFIGLEVAASAAELGWRVVVCEREPAPLARVLGPAAAELCVEAYADGPISLRRGVTLVADRSGGLAGGRVRLTDGTELAADAVLVGVGARPNVEWLAGSGVAVDDGVVCDGVGRSGRSGVWSAGDAARWPNAVTGRHDRIEQWQAAVDQGGVVADAMLAADGPAANAMAWARPPYFWSDLRGGRVQVVGHCDPAAPVEVWRGTRGVAALFGADRLVGALSVGAPRAYLAARRALLSGHSVAAARDAVRPTLGEAPH